MIVPPPSWISSPPHWYPMAMGLLIRSLLISYHSVRLPTQYKRWMLHSCTCMTLLDWKRPGTKMTSLRITMTTQGQQWLELLWLRNGRNDQTESLWLLHDNNDGIRYAQAHRVVYTYIAHAWKVRFFVSVHSRHAKALSISNLSKWGADPAFFIRGLT